MTNPNPNPNPNRIPNRVNSWWKNKPQNMAATGIRTRVTRLANRDATRYAKAPILQSFFLARYLKQPMTLPFL